MERNLEAYVKVYDNWIDHDLCDKVVENLQDADWEQHTFYNVQTGENENISGDKELDIVMGSTLTPEIHDRIWHAYQKYLQELNFPWFNGWQGFTQVRYNRYEETRLMALHCDHIHTAFDGMRKGIPTMTCLSALNDGYEGGEFIMFDDLEVKLGKGSTVVFPSVFLYPHTVKPVTKGVRYSCVAWAW